jgi:hypothetical protein
LIREARRATDKPILVYPNSGESYSAEKNDWNGDPVYESFGEEARDLVRGGRAPDRRLLPHLAAGYQSHRIMGKEQA